MSEAFRPHPLLRGAHAQTLYPFCVRSRRPPPWERERLELPDGDYVDLCHLGSGDGPRICLFHGLEGCVDSHYIGGLARALVACGLRVTFMHFRGCSGTPNRLPRAYHSGDTGDIAHLARTLCEREPGTTLAAVGFSLGANAMLKYLAQQGHDGAFAATVAVSPPMHLAVAARRIDTGFSRLYQRYLLGRMKRSTRARAGRLDGLPVDLARMERSRNFRAFDDCVTAPLHGFRDVDDYYSRSSAAAWLVRIETPTLLLHARDDPFLGPDGLPITAGVPGQVRFEISARGGHVGFIGMDRRGLPVRWLELRIPEWLVERLQDSGREPDGRGVGSGLE